MTGEWLNQYRIDAQLGAGGMGVVYRAYDTRLHRTVAIKRLQDPRLELSAERVLDEARAASILNHPNICTIYDVAENAGHPFIVMEYVDGRPLSEVDPRAGLPLKSVLKYRPTDRRCARLCARKRHRPSRHQGLQHHHHAQEPREGARLWLVCRLWLGNGCRFVGVAVRTQTAHPGYAGDSCEVLGGEPRSPAD